MYTYRKIVIGNNPDTVKHYIGQTVDIIYYLTVSTDQEYRQSVLRLLAATINASCIFVIYNQYTHRKRYLLKIATLHYIN